MRDFAKLRIDRANARMQATQDDLKGAQKSDDPVARLRERADTMATTAASLKKIADAADPLYKTLDDGQKRRLTILTHMERRFGGGEGWRHRGMDRGGDLAIGSRRRRPGPWLQPGWRPGSRRRRWPGAALTAPVFN